MSSECSETERTKIDPSLYSSREYTEGRGAFEEGQSMDDCPYPTGGSGASRIAWHVGWLDARTASRRYSRT